MPLTNSLSTILCGCAKMCASIKMNVDIQHYTTHLMSCDPVVGGTLAKVWWR